MCMIVVRSSTETECNASISEVLGNWDLYQRLALWIPPSLLSQMPFQGRRNENVSLIEFSRSIAGMSLVIGHVSPCLQRDNSDLKSSTATSSAGRSTRWASAAMLLFLLLLLLLWVLLLLALQVMFLTLQSVACSGINVVKCFWCYK